MIRIARLALAGLALAPSAVAWWDGTSVNRVQDNYVVQWGDATAQKPLPAGLRKIPESAHAAKRTPILSVRLASDLPDAARPRFEYLAGDSMDFARYVAARANRKDNFYVRPAGGLSNIVPPVRAVKG